jgi:hypothetical protein
MYLREAGGKLRTMKNKITENNNRGQRAPTSTAQGDFFEIRVNGHLDESWSDWLEGLEAKLLDNGEMRLCGQIADQAALMGILNKIYRLNLTLISLRKINQNK